MKQHLPYAVAKFKRADGSGAGRAAKLDSAREIKKWIVALETFRDKQPQSQVAGLLQDKVDDLKALVAGY